MGLRGPWGPKAWASGNPWALGYPWASGQPWALGDPWASRDPAAQRPKPHSCDRQGRLSSRLGGPEAARESPGGPGIHSPSRAAKLQ